MRDIDKQLVKYVKYLEKADLEYVDEEMKPIMLEFNKRNWFTDTSCQGHGDNWTMFVGFDKRLNLTNVPSEVCKNKNMYCISGHGEEERKKALEVFKNWALNLEKRKIYKNYIYNLSAVSLKSGKRVGLYSAVKERKPNLNKLIEEKSKHYKDFKLEKIENECW